MSGKGVFSVRKRRWLQQQLASTRTRIFVLFVIFNIVSVLLSDVILYHSSADVLFRQTCDIMENNLHSVSYSLDSALTGINEAISDVTLNRTVIDDLQKINSYNSYEYLLLNDRIKAVLNEKYRTSRLLQSVYLVSADFDYFIKSQINRTFAKEELLATQWADLLAQSKDVMWYVVSGDGNVVERNPDDMLMMVKRIFNPSYTSVLGYVSANIGLRELRRYVEQYQFGETGFLVLCNQEGKILYHPDKARIGQPFEPYQALAERNALKGSFQEAETLITYQRSLDSGLLYVAYTPVKEILVPITTLQKLVGFLLALSILLSVLYASIIASRLYAPIKVLISHMKQAAGGDTSVRIREVRYDEMGSLYEHFNYMISRIERLIQKLYEQEVMTKELRIKNLQIQLNPHFLYNILDSIHWAARENDMEDVCRMTFLLSRYFQKNLDNGRDLSKICDVASAMQAYMELQHIRYGDKLSYQIDVDPGIADCLVPKYLFQPLLENAVLHGIEKRSTTGVCLVSWTRVEERIRFCVEDNGLGIEPEKLAHIRASIEKSDMEAAEHFAFRNINTQLRLLYGPEYHLMIESTPDMGTKVAFCLPIRKEENDVQTGDH